MWPCLLSGSLDPLWNESWKDEDHRFVLDPWIGSCHCRHDCRCILLLQLEATEVEEGAGQADQDHAQPPWGTHLGGLQ